MINFDRYYFFNGQSFYDEVSAEIEHFIRDNPDSAEEATQYFFDYIEEIFDASSTAAFDKYEKSLQSQIDKEEANRLAQNIADSFNKLFDLKYPDLAHRNDSKDMTPEDILNTLDTVDELFSFSDPDKFKNKIHSMMSDLGASVNSGLDNLSKQISEAMRNLDNKSEHNC